jgi:hypothetical protein
MHDSLRSKLIGYGQRTYLAAWALEIVAALLGLTTGIALGYQAFSTAEPGSITSMDLILASAPFFMVSIAELTKIPIATLLFAVGWMWKPIVFLFLIALAGITFETVFMGLERAVTLRQFRYEEIVRKIDGFKFEKEQISSRIADPTLNDKLKQAQENLNAIAAQAEIEHRNLESQIAGVEKDIQGQRLLSPDAARTRDELARSTAERDKLVTERDTLIRESVGEFERQRESFVDRIKMAQTNGDTEKVRRYEGELEQLPNPRARYEAQYAAKIDPIEREIALLQAEFDRRMASAPPMSPTERQKLESQRDDLKTRLRDVDNAWAERRESASRQVEEVLGLQNNKATETGDQQRRVDEISDQLSRLETLRIEDARTDQVRRIAARIYGLKPESVSVDQAGFISIIWFGSLAILAALAGPLTAIVALSLQNIASREERAKEGRLSRAIRYTLLKWRWKRVRTVREPVEVPVDREVEKRIEVPVDRIIKEILYVPVLTDDPEAVRRLMDETLERDVADLVKISVVGTQNGNSSQHSIAGTSSRLGSAASLNSIKAG